MKTKKTIGIFVLCLIMLFGSFAVSPADTILFPVIAVNQPNVTTVVSVFNRPGSTSTHLKYIYRSKDSLVGGLPNHEGICATTSFTRPTFDGDLVSFDASGIFNSGNAMFSDPNSYGGGFGMGLSGKKRAYLLVTNADSGGNRVDVAHGQALGGEAAVMDIAYGAMWGMRGVNDTTQEDYDFTKSGSHTAIQSGGTNCKWFPFFPTNEWTTKFFVTPIGNSMNTANLTGSVTLQTSPGEGLYTREGTLQSFTKSTDLTCTTAVDLTEMIDSSVLATVENTGGWAFLCANDYEPATKSSDNPLVVYKLEYVVEDPTYGGTNNSGILLSVNDNAW